MIKISGFYLPFEIVDISTMLNHSKILQYREPIMINNDLRITLYESGHILSGATVIAEYDGKRVFYTGDINTRGTNLLRPADLDIGEIQLLIIEYHIPNQNRPQENNQRGISLNMRMKSLKDVEHCLFQLSQLNVLKK